MGDFTGRIAVVTGATSGIGRSVALAFAARGAEVIASGRDRVRGDAVVAEATAAGGRCSFIAANVGQERDVAALVEGVIARHGRIDAAVNSSGVNPHNPMTEALGEDFDRIFDTNTKGLFHCLKHLMRAMTVTGGAIVNIGSLGGERALPGKGLYCASKAAANMLVRTAAIEGGPLGIRVNEVAPGTIDTPMLRETWGRGGADPEVGIAGISAKVPARRLGKPEEIAAAVLFLCSDEARYINGASVAVDGGMVLAV